MTSDNEEIPYYKINKLLWRWKHQDGARVVRAVSLTMDKAPPPLPVPPEPPVAKAPASKLPKPDALTNVLDNIESVANTFSRFKAWLDAPEPPKPPPPPLKPVKKVETVPPFDIQEIPGAMRKEMMPISAKLMERWFAGRLNYSPTEDEESLEVNQDGKPYPPDMYDTTTVTLEWVLRYARAKEQYEYLINEAIRLPEARKLLKRKLIPYKGKLTLLDAENICKGDQICLHRQFRFQIASVDGTLWEKFNVFLRMFENNGAPDDLFGALGSFNFYATIGHARFEQDVVSHKITAEVRGIWVYVKDNFTFTTNPGERSQYLGHWNHKGVIVVPYVAVSDKSRYIPYVDAPVTIGDPHIKGNVYYPIHNSDFRQWAIKHQRGGDFIVFTDRRYVPVVPPIKVDL
ncbi:DUF6402 family protein [Trinickia sp. YCB016]